MADAPFESVQPTKIRLDSAVVVYKNRSGAPMNLPQGYFLVPCAIAPVTDLDETEMKSQDALRLHAGWVVQQTHAGSHTLAYGYWFSRNGQHITRDAVQVAAPDADLSAQ